MLNAEERFDCREIDLLAGDAEYCESESCESEGCEGNPCSWYAFHVDRVGELGVSDARRVWILRFGAENDVLAGLAGL